jgi:hypothetical protein
MKKTKYTNLLKAEIVAGLITCLIGIIILSMNLILGLFLIPVFALGIIIIFSSQHRLRSFLENSYLSEQLEDIEIKINNIITIQRKILKDKKPKKARGKK